MKIVHSTIRFSAALVLGSSPAWAHHSPAAFDTRPEALLALEGVVSRVEWANPHVYVYLETETDSGETSLWQLEVDTPAYMERHGWYRDSLLAGDEVTAHVFPARNASRKLARVTYIEKADGVRLAWGDPAALDVDAPAGVQANGLTGIWAPEENLSLYFATHPVVQVLRVASGQETALPLTEKGIAAIRSFTDESSPTVECTPRTVPSITMDSSGIHSIEVREDVVVLRENWFGTERSVHMDLSSHEGAPVALHGHSIGHFEGDVLVVDSARFAEHREGLLHRLPSSPEKHLIERFELNPDGMSLTYRWELSDPEYLTAPISGENRWIYRPDIEFETVECSIDNARRFLED